MAGNRVKLSNFGSNELEVGFKKDNFYQLKYEGGMPEGLG